MTKRNTICSYHTIAFVPVCVVISICHHELFAPMDQRYSHDHNGSAEYGNQSFLYRTIAFVPVCVAILICHHELFVPMDQRYSHDHNGSAEYGNQ